MLFDQFIEIKSPKVKKSLEQILSTWLEELEKNKYDIVELAREFIKSTKGGKLTRGVLAVLGFELFKKETPEILKVSSALEIFHTSIIAHDDIIDKSTERRGEPSLFESLGGNHYGVSQAICLADLGFFSSFKIISETNFDSEVKLKALSYLSEMMMNTAYGEMLDVKLSFEKDSYTDQNALNIALLKTAKYSVTGPLIMGSILANADEKTISALTEIGDNLGIAYQIQDDILGVFGSAEQTGKSAVSDILEGKATLLISHALEKSNPKQKRVLKELYGKSLINETEIEEVKKIFLETRALDFSNIKKIEYADCAKKLIEKLHLNKEKKELLTSLADFLIKRNK